MNGITVVGIALLLLQPTIYMCKNPAPEKPKVYRKRNTRTFYSHEFTNTKYF